jgi:imidazolonepropionase-like amidohydrolase
MAAARPEARFDAAIKPYEATLKAVATGGGTIVAGTDSPIVPYGLGLHVELESYVHAGLTPFQALQTATVNARWRSASAARSARSSRASSPISHFSAVTR